MTNDQPDHLPDDDFMKSSAEEWSKPTPQPSKPAERATASDRWGSPVPPVIPDEGNRWGSEKLDTSDSPQLKDLFPKKDQPVDKKKKFPWWIILIIALPLILLCIAVIVLLVIFL